MGSVNLSKPLGFFDTAKKTAKKAMREAVEAASKAVCGAGGAQEWGGMGRGDVG